jgi:hypothetical protein
MLYFPTQKSQEGWFGTLYGKASSGKSCIPNYLVLSTNSVLPSILKARIDLSK